ncbi:hypothetical protein RQP46_003466 [Phenoliferia psychrophenolica]
MSPWDIVGEGLLSLDPGKDEYEWAMSQQATAVKGFVLTYTEEIPPDAHPILQHLRWLDIYGPVNMEVSALDALLSESRNTLSTLTVIWCRAKLTELLRIIRLPNLASLRHLNLPGLQKPELSNPYGVALLEECEDRTIVFRCRYGYMTLAHLLEADDI